MTSCHFSITFYYNKNMSFIHQYFVPDLIFSLFSRLFFLLVNILIVYFLRTIILPFMVTRIVEFKKNYISTLSCESLGNDS